MASSAYEILKDFAGPFAAIVGAIVAGFISFFISRGQKRISQSQRDIALDQLKFNLLQKRYEIYQATKELLEYIPFVTDIRKCDSNKIRALSVTMDESRFYFPPEICNFLRDIRARCETFLTRLGQRDQISPNDSQEWAAMAEALAEDQKALRIIYANLPEVFEKSLAFGQLTKDQ